MLGKSDPYIETILTFSWGLPRSFPPLCLFNGSVPFQPLHNFVHEFLHHQSAKICSPIELRSLNLRALPSRSCPSWTNPRDNVSTGATVARICQHKRHPCFPFDPPLPLFLSSVVRTSVKVCFWHQESI